MNSQNIRVIKKKGIRRKEKESISYFETFKGKEI